MLKRILQNLHATYGESINLYNSTESSGASLIEAIERYKKYERKITDDLKPSEETLKRLSNAPLFQLGLNQSNQNLKSSNFTVFPNGGCFSLSFFFSLCENSLKIFIFIFKQIQKQVQRTLIHHRTKKNRLTI
jgi:hypothetical protein